MCIDTDTLRLILYCHDACDVLQEKVVPIGWNFVIQKNSMPVHSINDKRGIYWMVGATDVYQASFASIGFLLHLIHNLSLYPAVTMFVSC